MKALVLAAAALPPLYRAAVRALLRRNLVALNAGDPRPLFSSYADDVHFVFPGRSSWAADLHGREALEAWVRRFVEVGMEFDPDEIVVDGPPWSTRMCLRYKDRHRAPGGEIVYENRGIIFCRIAWGKLAYYEVNEDTEKVTAFDEYLGARGIRADV
ncbi:MAG: hypothetical protein JWN32_4238 [Solirubrobacterales bacterium]|nr:hypothetical protein [Solirubrobacterales bacterium]